ncbi:MAG: hypothetical protein RJA70_5014 [Pseudomonadota bacterium]|jgi:hypothetical protein
MGPVGSIVNWRSRERMLRGWQLLGYFIEAMSRAHATQIRFVPERPRLGHLGASRRTAQPWSGLTLVLSLSADLPAYCSASDSA